MNDFKAGIHREETHTVGQNVVIDCASPSQPYGVVFEDDGETGYFYAVEFGETEDDLEILDAQHIYDVAQVQDGDEPAKFSIAWTDDGYRAVLLIEGSPWAAVDFARRFGLCRSNFPPPAEGVDWEHLPWNEQLLERMLRGEQEQ